MNILDFQRMYDAHQKISMVTCYDYWSAAIIAKSEVDCVLVGDSVAMVMHGHPTTVTATLPMMVMHTAAVARGAGKKFVVGDLPFLSYRKSLAQSMDAVQQLMQAGAQAVKLEGGHGNEDLIAHLVASGVAVMGHIGLTPQSVHQLGGFKVQGKTQSDAENLMQQALLLQQAGCFAIVLECVPQQVAKTITDSLKIPTIGIGAGPHTSGQVLVLQDLLGCHDDLNLKFLKKFSRLHDDVLTALNQYDTEVKTVDFPAEQHCFSELAS